jgi:hypothetical protein
MNTMQIIYSLKENYMQKFFSYIYYILYSFRILDIFYTTYKYDLEQINLF